MNHQTRATRTNQYDRRSKEMVFEGCTQTQLAQLFRMDRRDVSVRLINSGVRPCGDRAGYPIYAVNEVAPFLVKALHSSASIEEHLRKMNPADLPKVLSKEFWSGQRSRQEYMVREGDLWPTEKVLSVISEAFKEIRLSVLLTADAVNRQHMLTDSQRDRINAMMDGLLNDMADRLQALLGPRMDGRAEPDAPNEEDDGEL